MSASIIFTDFGCAAFVFFFFFPFLFYSKFVFIFAHIYIFISSRMQTLCRCLCWCTVHYCFQTSHHQLNVKLLAHITDITTDSYYINTYQKWWLLWQAVTHIMKTIIIIIVIRSRDDWQNREEKNIVDAHQIVRTFTCYSDTIFKKYKTAQKVMKTHISLSFCLFSGCACAHSVAPSHIKYIWCCCNCMHREKTILLLKFDGWMDGWIFRIFFSTKISSL